MERPFGSLFWRLVAFLLFAAALAALGVRFTSGLRAATNLSDSHPWGLWFGFNVVCAGGIAAGSLALASAYYLLRLNWLRPVLRPVLLTAWLGYVSVAIGFMIELQRPWDLWRPLVLANPRSQMFEVPWCVLFSFTLLALEFATDPLEKRGWSRALRIVRSAAVPVAGCSFLFAVLREASLGNLLLAMAAKLHPLWSSPLLPFFFVLSAVLAGLAAVVFVNGMGERAFGRIVEFGLWQRLLKLLAIVLATWLALRLGDLYGRGSLAAALTLSGPGSFEAWLFWLELGLFAVPMLALWRPLRESPELIFFASAMVIGAFLFSRLNVSVSALEASAGARYLPSWMEGAVAAAIVALDFVLFAMAARRLPLFSPPAIADYE